MSETAKIIINGKEYELPVITGSEGEQAIDIAQLRALTGVITLDNGFTSTGSCQSAITFLDGEKGILRYRGYRIEELCQKSSFLEVAYLLINGELPNAAQEAEWEHHITHHSMIKEDIKRYWDAWPQTAHPMALLSSVTSALSTFYEDSHNVYDPRQVEISIHRLIAKMPTVAAYAYKKSQGQPYMYPINRYNYIERFLYMMFALPVEEYKMNPVLVKALNQILILHADHEQNCSTSTVRLVGSSHANLFASIAAGVTALWGPLHGGANQAVLEMLDKIHADGGNVDEWVAKAKDKDDNFKLMGFGHRVYKNFDPRALILKETADEVLATLGVVDPRLEIARKLEEIALSDPYFIERKLYPNVDFYSGIIYKAMGFPTKMFTVLFALGRLPGWIAQWKEMIESKETKIGRPRQIYTGATERPWVPVNKR